jgi:hypothetical protein
LNPKRAEICGSLLSESASAQAMPGGKNIKFLLLYRAATATHSKILKKSKINLRNGARRLKTALKTH